MQEHHLIALVYTFYYVRRTLHSSNQIVKKTQSRVAENSTKPFERPNAQSVRGMRSPRRLERQF